MTLSAVKSDFEVPIGLKISGVDNSTFSLTGEAYSHIGKDAFPFALFYIQLAGRFEADRVDCLPSRRSRPQDRVHRRPRAPEGRRRARYVSAPTTF